VTRPPSLWIDRDHDRDADHGPFSSARWRRQAEAARRPQQQPEEPPPAEPTRRRWRAVLLPTVALATAVLALALGLIAVLGGDDDGGAALLSPDQARPAKTIEGRVYQSAGAGVVSVQAGAASGTGFAVRPDGTIVTNAHVVADAETAQVRFKDRSRQVDAEVLGTDPSSDLAVLRVDPGAAGGIHPLALADSDRVRVGDAVVAIGHPFGLDRTATAGIVSGVGRHIQAPNGFEIDEVIQTDAAINPGNSGGPLLDTRGRVVGVNSQIATAGSGGNVGIGFAIPANTVREVVPRLSRGERIKHAYLGVTMAPAPGGAAVQGVASGGPAARAGLQAGDVIASVDGNPVAGPDDVSEAVSNHQPGDEIEVEVIRGGQRRTITVTLDSRPRHTP
jgi:putative serine protease PepD